MARVGYLSAALIGATQALALLAGISREGVAMVGGLFRGLTNENALRFSFLLSTPVILAAGVLKIPDLLGTLGNGIRAQVIVGSLAAAVSSLFAIIFLSRYFRTRTLGYISAAVIGAGQALALLAGISREGVAMVGGLFRGLTNENALRFSFLLSTPVILAAGVLKIPDLLGTLGNGIRAQVIVGSLAAAASSLFAIIFLSRYFRTRTLIPFAVYSLAFGFVSVIRFAIY